MKRIAAAAAALCAAVSFAVPAGAQVRAGMSYSQATGSAVPVTADMITGISSADITAEWIEEHLFTYDEESNDELTLSGNSTSSSYTIDFGEEKKNISTVRVFIAGTGGEEHSGITVYAALENDSEFFEAGSVASTQSGSWNDIAVSAGAPCRYYRIETDTSAAEEPSATATPESIGDDEDGTEQEDVPAAETGSDYVARTAKTVLIQSLAQTDEDVENAGGSTDVGQAGGLGYDSSAFSDTQGHWAEGIIAKYTEAGHLSGYPDGTFKPDNTVSAAEFAKIMGSCSDNYYQITTGYWAMPYIRDLLTDGIFDNGEYSDYSQPMTREQAAKAIIASLKSEYFPSDLSQFTQYITDYDTADDKYKDSIIKAFMSGVMSGYEDGSFAPKKNVTRAEILTIIDRALNPDARVIPEVIGSAMDEPETFTYYTAAVQVRKNTNANSQNYRLYSANARYMEEDDAETGLRLFNEVQGAQGMAFLMRFDLSDILEREDTLESLTLDAVWARGGDFDLGLWFYEPKISDVEWNRGEYSKVVNGSAVAGDDKTGYNAVCDNITAILPTWGDIENAVPQEQKTQPFAQAKKDGEDYVFELTGLLDELKAHADENNIVEFFITTVNYDRYGTDQDNKPQIYTAGANAPQLHANFKVEGGAYQTRYTLLPADAELEGGMLEIENTDGMDNIGMFTEGQAIVFNVDVQAAGEYGITFNYSANIGSGGGTVLMTVNGTEYEHAFEPTGSWTTYQYEDAGTIELQAGENEIRISDKEITGNYLINIREIVLEKIE